MSDNNLTIALSYYGAINQNNPGLAAEKLADNVRIISPLATKDGKADVVEALKGLCSTVEGVTVTDTFNADALVMLALNMLFPAPVGVLRAASLLDFEQGLIARIELFYDSRVMLGMKDAIFSSKGSS